MRRVARDVGGIARTVKVSKRRDGTGALRIVKRRGFTGSGSTPISVSALSAQVDTDAVSGAVNSRTARNISTQQATASASGGVTPYSYSWAQTGASAYTWTADNPSSAATRFTAHNVPANTHDDAVFVCTVTDAVGNHAASPSVAASVTNFSSGGSGPLP